jgi:fructokinase
MAYYWSSYRRDAKISESSTPFDAPSLAGSPPTVITTAGYDPLRDEGEQFADRLRYSGIPTIHIPSPTLIHGWVDQLDRVPAAAEAFREAVAAFDELRTHPAERKQVLVVGEALIDAVRGRDGSEVHSIGGSPLNVAIGLSRLGMEVELLTHIGSDRNGRTITAALEAEGVTLSPTSTANGATSIATATLADDGQARYDFEVSWDVDAGGVGSADAVHVGSYAAFLAPGDDAVLEVARAARDAGRLVALDPNIRPALLPERSQVVLRFFELLKLADVVKLSDEDAQYLFPAMSLSDVLDHLLSCGPRLAVVTKGSAGAEFRTADSSVDLPAEAVEVVDTIGAGDSFMSALIQKLLTTPGPLDQIGLQDLARYCATAAAITVGRRGANPPTSRELDSALRSDEESHVHN